jgi:hypothetical protein
MGLSVTGKQLAWIFGFATLGLLHAQPASLSGTALNSLTHQPMGGVHVTLRMRMEQGFPTNTFGAISDATGHFSVTNVIPPGNYAIRAERAGFVYTGSLWITFHPGESIPDQKVEMTPQAAIVGRVADENSDPFADAFVEAVAEHAGSGKLAVSTMGMGESRTDERGEFRLHGAPGKYRLRVTPLRHGRDGSGADYAVTYFPGAFQEEAGTLVDAQPGKEVMLDIMRLARRHTLAIRGAVTGLSDPSRVMIYLRSTTFNPGSAAPVMASADGTFSFSDLQPGEYRLGALCTSSNRQSSCSKELGVSLDTTDLSGIELPILVPGDLTGTLKMPAGRKASAVVVQVTVNRFPDGQTHRGEVDLNGSFSIKDVYPEHYWVRVEDLEGNEYIKEMKLADKAVNSPIDLSGGVNGAVLKVTVSSLGGQISGKVTGSHRAVRVFLVSDLEHIFLQASYPVAPDGTYAIHGIHPGKYRLFAIEEELVWSEGLDFVKAVANLSEDIGIVESAKLIRDLTARAKEKDNVAR